MSADTETAGAGVPLTSFKRICRMSPAQSRYWFAEQYMNDPTQSNTVLFYKVKGDFDVPQFEKALTEVVSRHESLQTAFFLDTRNSELVQAVRREPLPYFEHVETSDCAAILCEFDRAKSKIWRLDQGEVFRVAVLSPRKGDHALVFSFPHLVLDVVSWSRFLKELDTAYQMKPLAPIPPSYTDYTDEQYRAIESAKFDRQFQYWRETLTPLPEPMPTLPFARVKNRMVSEDIGSHTTTAEIKPSCTERVKAISRSLRGSPFHFHLSVIQILLSRLLENDDVCIGTTDAGRSDPRFNNTLGFFVNTLPLRLRLNKQDKFTDVFRRTSQTSFSAMSNSNVPFGHIVDQLKVPRSTAHTPLFQLMVNYRMGEVLNMPLGGATLQYAQAVQARSPYDMTINITPSATGSWMLEVVCRNYIYSPQHAQQFVDMYVHLLDQVTADHSLLVGDYPLVPKRLIDEAIHLGEGEVVDTQWPTTLIERFDNVARDRAAAIAVKDASGAHSYADLAAQVNRVAHALLNKGIEAGTRVAVLCEPSMESVAGMLAVLRTGAAYVPVDIRLPVERQTDTLNDCCPAVLVCQSVTLERARSLKRDDMDTIIMEDLADNESTMTSNRGDPTSLAFILYSSGSTGKPKGIMLRQAMFTNWMAAQSQTFSGRPETVLQQSSLGFDMSIAQTFLALAFGGSVVIVPQNIRFDPIEISRLMVAEGVTLTFATPAEYTMLLRYGSEYLTLLRSWRHVYVGGELVTGHLIREFHQRLGPHCPGLTVCYGPTEAGGVVCTRVLPFPGKEKAIRNLGKVFINTSFYIVDENLNPLPVGFPGEVCIGGVGVGLGYLNMPGSEDKFVANPFAGPEYRSRGWTQLYRTGDMGHLLEDGSLMFMGRMNGGTQVKLRGLRVDLEDVSHALLKEAPDIITHAVVSARGEGESQFLVSHVVLAPGKPVSEAELQSLAASLPLPQYMRPSLIIPVDGIPTTPNGKVDRKAIEALSLPSVTSNSRSASTSVNTLAEAELKMLWEEILYQTAPAMPIEAKSDFFAVGGTSVLLVQLQGAIRNSTGLVIPLADLFKASTLEKMALILSTKKSETKEDTIDWDQETKAPKDFMQYRQSLCTKPAPCCKPSTREVLMTGSTSFIGKAILDAMLQDSTVTKVHCIAVAPEQQASLPVSKRVVVYTGKLMDPMLGLSKDEHEDLRTRINLIVHAGTFGHCLNRYASLRVPNFHSTRFLAELALRAQIPLHYISSNRVTLLSGRTTFPPVSVSAHMPPTDGSEGFVAAKWASERFLEAAAKEVGLQVCIHRPSYVIGDDAPSTDTVNAVIRFSRLLGAVPGLENMSGFMDFRDVHDVAQEIVQECADSPRKLSIRHHSSRVKVPVSEMGSRLGQLYGGQYSKMNTREWLVRAGELGMDSIVVKYMDAICEAGEERLFPYLEPADD